MIPLIYFIAVMIPFILTFKSFYDDYMWIQADVVNTTTIEEMIRREADEMARVKKSELSWKMKDGKEVKLDAMSDDHLANAIRMIARNCHKSGYLGTMTSDATFLKLVNEGKRRKFRITILNIPTKIHERMEYVDVFIPHPRSKLAAGFFPTEWDSRPQD